MRTFELAEDYPILAAIIVVLVAEGLLKAPLLNAFLVSGLLAVLLICDAVTSRR